MTIFGELEDAIRDARDNAGDSEYVHVWAKPHRPLESDEALCGQEDEDTRVIFHRGAIEMPLDFGWMCTACGEHSDERLSGAGKA